MKDGSVTSKKKPFADAFSAALAAVRHCWRPMAHRNLPLPRAHSVDVIIPVYGHLTQTRRCVESVLQTRSLNRRFGRLFLIDDCSPDASVNQYLNDVARRDRVVLLRNSTNRGFVASVNRGISASRGSDVVLLNSDTEVSGNWLD